MFQFIKQYVRHPFTIGALAPSSKYLAACMTAPIEFEHCDCIVEYGPGTGVFTREIIKRKKEETLFIIIEQNKEFYDVLVNQYGDCPGVKLIHGTVENMEAYLKEFHIETVDYIVSGLPFASLPKTVSRNILEKTRDAIGENGTFITFQYTMLKRGLFEQFFTVRESHREYRNFPPAYVLVMEDYIC